MSDEVRRLVITRKEARERGLKAYWTGKPCERFQHIAERTTGNGVCVECRREHSRCCARNPAATNPVPPGYYSWGDMVQRCENPNHPKYALYGGRPDKPVRIHPRYRYGEGGLSGYHCLIADIGPKPGPGYSLDRIDPWGNYEPGNVRWADPETQARNQRPRRQWTRPRRQRADIADRRKKVSGLTARGLAPSQVAKLLGLPRHTITNDLRQQKKKVVA